MLTTFQLITLDYWENVYNMVSLKSVSKKNVYSYLSKLRSSPIILHLTIMVEDRVWTGTYLILCECDFFSKQTLSPTCYILPPARSCATNGQVKANCEHIWTAMWVLVVHTQNHYYYFLKLCLKPQGPENYIL